MGKCKDDFDFDKRFLIIGRGKTEDDTKKDFDAKLKSKLDELKTVLKCEENVCSEVELGGAARTCTFDYAEVDDERKCVEKSRKLKIHRRKRKYWECSQRFDVGCFCIGLDDKDKDE